ncbi:glycosyltransferase family 9 protein [Pedobacter sp. BS3]|uniref:glycosyltransferase family 9 protein n=1 Tax=Pedobacter sp. BS3 TaxID=2567937 RepID=UPI0011EE33C0|nr:glycosyltransferase family 9 protein [Pedobacter sp. BS3]TZF83697.1 glycosyltransferase family 9 protein [Pedobacter sp. BS3]
MHTNWENCKHILCIRPDNMGDLVMSSPAIRALKETFGAKISVLTSSAAAGIAGFIPEIDDVIVYDLPWVKHRQHIDPDQFPSLITTLKNRQFDAAVMFSVYSQNILPTAMIPYFAGIPKRLAYCRENPYALLTDWVPDKEPYSFIRHQVKRDLDLVAHVGAFTLQQKLALSISPDAWESAKNKLTQNGIFTDNSWLILHAGVSEAKREYPEQQWAETARQLVNMGYQVLFTGGPDEKTLTDRLCQLSGPNTFSLAGSFSLEEYIALIRYAPLVISVNTATIHLAAATETPVIVLYALSNPQHTPWMAKGSILTFDVPSCLQSKNEVIRYVYQLTAKPGSIVSPDEIVHAAWKILNGHADYIPEILPVAIPVELSESSNHTD